MKAFVHLKEKNPLESKNIPIEILVVPRKGEIIVLSPGGNGYIVDKIEYALFDEATYPIEIYASHDGEGW